MVDEGPEAEGWQKGEQLSLDNRTWAQGSLSLLPLWFLGPEIIWKFFILLILSTVYFFCVFPLFFVQCL